MNQDEKDRYEAEYKRAMAAEIRRLFVFFAAMLAIAIVVVLLMMLR